MNGRTAILTKGNIIAVVMPKPQAKTRSLSLASNAASSIR
jgi:hypothetical protein